jgi:hypothetical protein
MVVCLESRLLPTLDKRPLLIDTKQLAQFKFRSEEILKGVLIQFPEKSLDSFSHCRAQRTARRNPAVARRIFAFDDREVRFHLADHFAHDDPVWRLSQAQIKIGIVTWKS